MVLVPELGALGLALFCLALALAATIIVEALKNYMGGVPIIGKVIGSILNPVIHALSWAAGQLETGVDAILGATFHTLAKVLEWTFDYYKSQASLLLQLAHLVGNHIPVLSGIQAEQRVLQKEYKGIEHGIKTLNREYHGIEGQIGLLQGQIYGLNEKGLRKHLRVLDREIAGIDTKIKDVVLPGINTAEGEVTQLGNFIKAIPGTRYLDWVAGLVAAAVGIEIVNLLKCTFLRNLWNKRGCGLWNGLEGLLALFIDTLILVDLCAILPEAVKFFGVVEGALTGLISQAANAVCAASNKNWTNPNVAPGPRPPAQAFDATSLAPDG